jgi:condensin complex subunit 1
MVEVLGHLIREVAMSDDTNGEPEAREKRLNNLFDLLIERFLDLSSYVRAKVLVTLSKLCDLPVKLPKQRLKIVQHTIDSLEDKGSSVRRQAVALLTKLILTHPYGLMHGGLLKLEEWEERYNEVVRELEAIDVTEMPAQEGEEDDDDDEDEDEDEQPQEEVQGEDGNDTDEEANTTITSSPMKAANKRMR